MKKLFFILAILNLLFFGLLKIYETPSPIDWRAREVRADSVKIVTGQLARFDYAFLKNKLALRILRTLIYRHTLRHLTLEFQCLIR